MNKSFKFNKHKTLNIAFLLLLLFYFFTNHSFRFTLLYPIRYINMNYFDNVASKIKRWDWNINETQLKELKKIGPDSYQWIPQILPIWVAHRMGPGFLLDNTLKSLNNGYQLGARIFEVDLVLTEDNQVYCYHPTEKEERKYNTFHSIFKSQLVLNHFNKINEPVCKFEDLIQFAKMHNDSYFILDVKTDFAQSYARMYEFFKQDKKLLARFIPQIYWWYNLKTLENLSGFAGPIFTGYQTGFSTDEMIEFAEELGIKVVTLDARRVSFYQKKFSEDLVFLMHGHWNMDLNITDGHNKGIDGYYLKDALPLFWNKIFHP